MTPEQIQELAVIDERIANAVVACDASYIELKEAITAYTNYTKAIQA